jgi:hypothetical protein
VRRRWEASMSTKAMSSTEGRRADPGSEATACAWLVGGGRLPISATPGPDHAGWIILRRAGCWHCPGGASFREPIPVPVWGRAPAAPSGSRTPHSVPPASLPTMCHDCRGSPSIRVRSSRCRRFDIDLVVLYPPSAHSARRSLASHAVQC